MLRRRRRIARRLVGGIVLFELGCGDENRTGGVRCALYDNDERGIMRLAMTCGLLGCSGLVKYRVALELTCGLHLAGCSGPAYSLPLADDKG